MVQPGLISPQRFPMMIQQGLMPGNPRIPTYGSTGPNITSKIPTADSTGPNANPKLLTYGIKGPNATSKIPTDDLTGPNANPRILTYGTTGPNITSKIPTDDSTGQRKDSNLRCFCLFCCFMSQVNSYGHCGTVSSPKHTFSWAGLNKRLTSNLCTYFPL